jgi:hypothetical protein
LEDILPKIKAGGVYEIKLLDKYYLYVCEIREYCFGIFDIVSETPVDIETIKNIKFKNYKDCKRPGITKKIWKKIGTMDNIESPDIARWLSFDPDGLKYKEPIIFRDGLVTKVTLEEYIKVLETGFIFGVWDNYENFQTDYLIPNIENIKNNKPMTDQLKVFEELNRIKNNGVRPHVV